MLLLGFMWNDRRDIALRRGSLAQTDANSSFRGDCGTGEESRDVFRVPAPDADVAVDMNEKRERPRSWSSWIWCWETGVEATDDISTDGRSLAY